MTASSGPRTTPVAHQVAYVERGSSVVEHRTRNRDSPGSNPLCYRFAVLAFSYSPQCPSSLSCIIEYLAIDGGGNVSE